MSNFHRPVCRGRAQKCPGDIERDAGDAVFFSSSSSSIFCAFKQSHFFSRLRVCHEHGSVGESKRARDAVLRRARDLLTTTSSSGSSSSGQRRRRRRCFLIAARIRAGAIERFRVLKRSFLLPFFFFVLFFVLQSQSLFIKCIIIIIAKLPLWWCNLCFCFFFFSSSFLVVVRKATTKAAARSVRRVSDRVQLFQHFHLSLSCIYSHLRKCFSMMMMLFSPNKDDESNRSKSKEGVLSNTQKRLSSWSLVCHQSRRRRRRRVIIWGSLLRVDLGRRKKEASSALHKGRVRTHPRAPFFVCSRCLGSRV